MVEWANIYQSIVIYVQDICKYRSDEYKEMIYTAHRQPSYCAVKVTVKVSTQSYYAKCRPFSEWNTLCINSLWPGDAIWRHRSGSTLVR